MQQRSLAASGQVNVVSRSICNNIDQDDINDGRLQQQTSQWLQQLAYRRATDNYQRETADVQIITEISGGLAHVK
jgi:hypothetical protein